MIHSFFLPPSSFTHFTPLPCPLTQPASAVGMFCTSISYFLLSSLSLCPLSPHSPPPLPLSLSFSALCLVHVARCPLKQHVHYTLLFKRKDRYMKGLEVISRAPGVQRILSLLINIAILLAREHRYHKFSFSTPEKK